TEALIARIVITDTDRASNSFFNTFIGYLPFMVSLSQGIRSDRYIIPRHEYYTLYIFFVNQTGKVQEGNNIFNVE
ncbi:MAG TPA: hypothetical protein PLP87_11825, partial [Clostridiales bacterium]|nr:hypothetical protein [Clostridiales bacterium]